MACSLVLNALAVTPVAAEEPYVTEEPQTEPVPVTEEAEDGSFSLDVNTAEIPEGGSLVLKLHRGGDELPPASVRLSFIDITADYGRDYTVRILSSSQEEQQPEIAEGASSIMEEIQNDPDSIVEQGIVPQEDEIVEQGMGEISDLINKELSEYAAKHPENYVIPVEEAHEETGRSALSEAFTDATGLEDDNLPMSSDGSSVLDLNALLSGYTLDTMEDFAGQFSSAAAVISFEEGETDRYIRIEAVEDEEARGNLLFMAAVFSASESAVIGPVQTCTASIIDNEQWQVPSVGFSAESYTASDGYLTVTMTRSGIQSGFASVHLSTADNSAVNGRDYSEVDVTVDFVPGVSERTIRIPVRSKYLDSTSDFSLILSQAENCEITLPQAQGIITADSGDYVIQAEDAAIENDLKYAAITGGNNPVALDLSGGYASTHNNASASWTGDRIKLTANGWTWDDSYCTYSTTDNGGQYPIKAFRALRLDWEKDGGGDSETSVTIMTGGSSRWGGNGSYTVKDWRKNSWDRKKEDIELEPSSGYSFGHLTFYDDHNGSPFSSKSVLEIYGAQLLPRPLVISADVYNKDTLKFIDEYGKPVSYQQAKLPGVGSFNISGQTDSATHYIGDTVTVTTDDTYTYIKALWVGDHKITADYPAGTRSASFKLDRYFYDDHHPYIDAPDKTGSAKMTVRVELGQYEAPVILHNDDIRGSLEFAFDANKNVIHKGDYVAIRQRINPDYTASHTQSMIHMEYKTRADAIDYENPYMPFNRGSADTYTFQNIYSDVQVYPVFEPKDNRIVVRIAEKDLSHFNTESGIFAGARETAPGGYVDFTAVGSDEIQTGKRYELIAETLDNSYTAVWQPFFTQNRYSQERLWFEAKQDPADNVVMLSAEKTDAIPYSLSGTAYYADYSLLSGAEGEAWMPADGVMVQLSPSAYGLSDTTGHFASIPAYGIEGCRVQYRVIAMGRTDYRTITLTKAEEVDFGNGITAYDVPLGTVNVSPLNKELPYVSSVSLTSGTATGSLIAYMDAKDSGGITNTFTIFINNEHTPYIDNNGEEKAETVKAVHLYAYDPLTNVLRGQIGGDGIRIAGSDTDDRSVWQISSSLAEGTGFYQASDRIYIRITTDRKQADAYDENGNLIEFENFNETSYPDLYTGIVLSSIQPSDPPSYDLDLLDSDLDQFFKLPIFSSMNCTFLIKGFSMSFQMLPGNVHRFSIGKILNNYDYMNDTGTKFDGFADGVSKISEFGKQVKGDGKVAPVKNGGLHPFLGIYLDFAPGKIELSADATEGELALIGAGIYAGVKAYGQFNFYLPICCVPVYFGIQLSATAYVSLGIHDTRQITYHSLKDGTAPLGEGIEPDFTFKAEGWAAVYAGVGLACTLGVRGGVCAFAQYMYMPTVKKTHPDFNEHGAKVTIQLKVWIDAFFFNIPIPVLNMVNESYGLIYQMEHEFDDQNSSSSLTESSVALRDMNEPSSWLPAKQLLRTAVSSAEETVLQKGGYDHADPQLLDMGEYGTLLVFLGLDTSREAADQTVLMYSICQNGSWSEPQPVGSEKTLSTADFQPDICDAGDSVMISWISRENVPYSDTLEYLGTMDVYTCMFSKATHEITEVECLSEGDFNDVGYYNCSPVSVYDELSGDRLVYYQKSAAEEKAVDEALYTDISPDSTQLLANVSPTQNGNFITYMLYDHTENDNQGGWARTHIYENEVSSESARENLITNWGGQRFLASPVNEEDWNVSRPVIIDFDAICYNGIAVYAYTLDRDNSLDTEYDRDLFMQVYDFESHRTFHPIRIKNDSVSDARPQLIRTLYTDSEGALKAHTWLFWLEGVSVAQKDENGYIEQADGIPVLRYVDAGELIEFGINDDGTIGRNGYNVAEESHVLYYQTLGERNDPFFSSYNAFVDKDDNLYVSWLQTVSEENSMNASQEIYASALVDRAGGTAWSDPVALTKSGMVHDEMAIATDSAGRLITVSNRYTINAESPAGEVRDLSLVAASYEDAGSLEAISVTYPVESPLAGETVTASINIRNTGLCPAEGYTMRAYEIRNGIRSRTPLYTADSANSDSFASANIMAFRNDLNADDGKSERIVPGQTVAENIEWTMPDDLKDGDTLGLYVEVSEKGVDRESTKTSELEGPQIGAKLELVSVETKEEQDGFYLVYEIRNSGNVPSRNGMHLKAVFNDLYNEGMEGTWLNAEVEPLEPGESRYYTEKMEIADEVFTYGFANGYAELYDEKDERTYIGTDFIAAMEFPFRITVNNDPLLEEIILSPGESLELSGTYGPDFYYKDGTVQFTTGNGEIAHMEGNRLVADQAGTTILRVFVSPYGGEKLIRITVPAKDSPQPSPAPSPTPAPGPGNQGGQGGRPASNTSDSNHIPLYGGIFAGSLLLILAVLWLKKKEQ